MSFHFLKRFLDKLFLPSNDSKITWNDASSACHLGGAYLVSYNDQAEWKNISSLLYQHGVKAHVGLQSFSIFVTKRTNF